MMTRATSQLPLLFVTTNGADRKTAARRESFASDGSSRPRILALPGTRRVRRPSAMPPLPQRVLRRRRRAGCSHRASP